MLDPLPLQLRTNIHNFLINYLGTPDRPVPFGGRRDALERLEQWRMHSDKRFLLLTAEAGRGKSALLTRWAQMLCEPERSKSVAVVFIPISIRFNTNLPELIFPCIAVQLAELLEQDIPSNTVNMPPGFWQNLVGEYLRQPLPDDRQLLLIVDGLDEAAWEVNPTLFPQDLPSTTRVVVSARYLAGEAPGAKPWLGRLGWARFNLAQSITLEKLTRDGLREVLNNIGRPLDALLAREDVLSELFRLTDGDPLLVELYIDWLHEQGESLVRLNPSDLARIEPDYAGFFRFWWQAQEQLWLQMGQTDPMEKATVQAVLSILAAALGPLSISDFKALLPAEMAPSKHLILQAMRPLRRFIIGDGQQMGFSFSHPRLADFFSEEFLDDEELHEWHYTFVEWGQRILEYLQAADHPDYQISPYLLEYYGRHLTIAGAPVDEYLSLLSWEWMQCWHSYTRTYAGFLRDVDIVLEQLITADSQAIADGLPALYIGYEVLCGLCHASVNSLAEHIPTGLLVALRQNDYWNDEQVLAYARRRVRFWDRSKTLRKLAPHLSSQLQQDAYLEAFQAALSEDDKLFRVVALSGFAQIMPEIVYKEALASLDDRHLPIALRALAPYLPQQAFQTAQYLQKEEAKAGVITTLVPYLTGTLRNEAVQQALQLAQSLKDKIRQATLLADIAPYLPEPDRTHAINQVLSIANTLPDEDYHDRLDILNSLVPVLPESEQNDVIGQAMEITQSLADDRTRADSLIQLAPYFSPVQREKVLRQALEASLELPHDQEIVVYLSKLAPYLADEVYQAAQTLDDIVLAELLESLAPYLSKPDWISILYTAVEACQAIEDYDARFNIVSDLDNYLSDMEETEFRMPQGLDFEILTRSWSNSTPKLDTRHWPDLSYEHEQLLVDILDPLVYAVDEVSKDEALYQVLQKVKAIQDNDTRANILIKVQAYFPEEEQGELLREALQLTKLVENEKARGALLSTLARDFPEEVYIAACLLQDETVQGKVLEGLAPHLPEVVYKAARTLSNDFARIAVFRTLAAHLPVAIFQEFQAMQNDIHRIWVLRELAPHIPEMVYKEAQLLHEPLSRALVMASLTDYLMRLPATVSYSVWLDILSDLQRLERENAFQILSDLLPVMHDFGNRASLLQTKLAVERVIQWWP